MPVVLEWRAGFNLGNAVLARAAAAEPGVDPAAIAAAVVGMRTVGDRYTVSGTAGMNCGCCRRRIRPGARQRLHCGNRRRGDGDGCLL
jgi:hypothetical protein